MTADAILTTTPAAAPGGKPRGRRLTLSRLLIIIALGLIGLPDLLGNTHSYTTDFTSGLGFLGIAVALLGRNHPVGMAVGAFLWGFLARSQIILDLDEIPKEIVLIMQGVTVFAVVVAYELANRIGATAQQRRVGATAARAPVAASTGASLTIEETK